MKRNLKLLEFLKCHNEKVEEFNGNVKVFFLPLTTSKTLQSFCFWLTTNISTATNIDYNVGEVYVTTSFHDICKDFQLTLKFQNLFEYFNLISEKNIKLWNLRYI